jgi:LysM domain
MSALSALEAVDTEVIGTVEAPAHLHLVARPATVAGPLPAGPRAGSSDRPSRSGRGEMAPVRLTRRGRIVVAALGLAVATLAALLLSLAASGGAQASDHGRPGAGYQGMRQIVVRPGQTLWSIASQTEPSVDPRQVIPQIMAANSMTSTSLQAGELLWVPR